MFTGVYHKIRIEMQQAFAELDEWFDLDTSLVSYQPADGGWSIREILEHVSLTNHYLLILIKKGRKR
jgi:hypothetical protein